MAKLRTYLCEACDGKFEYLHHPSTDPPPKFCPLCGASFEDEPQVAIPSKVNYAGLASAGRAGDMTYRQLEESSAARAEAAGDPSLKITDLSDNTREGDIAAKVPNNFVTRHVAETGHQFWQGGDMGIQAGLAAAKMAPKGRDATFAAEAIQLQRIGRLH